MNVTYYLTIDKVLVHFGSEVRKVSYICLPNREDREGSLRE
jgi:hypothetical protein